MTYKGYQATVELDEDAGVFHGEVINTRDVITFQGTSVKELRKAFMDSVDDYLEFCAGRGEDAEKPFSGKFLVRVPPAVHRRIMTEARQQGKSLNAYVMEKLAGNTQKPQMESVLSNAARESAATAAGKRWSEYRKKKLKR